MFRFEAFEHQRDEVHQAQVKLKSTQFAAVPALVKTEINLQMSTSVFGGGVAVQVVKHLFRRAMPCFQT